MKKGWFMFIVWLLLIMSTTPALADDPTSDNPTDVGADPVTGRNEGFNITWVDSATTNATISPSDATTTPHLGLGVKQHRGSAYWSDRFPDCAGNKAFQAIRA